MYIIKMMYITFTHIRPLAQDHVNSFVDKGPTKDPHHVYITEDRTGGRLGEGILTGGRSFPFDAAQE